MALEFNVVKLEKDSRNRHYNAKIEFQGRAEDYEIRTNANIRYLEYIDCLSVLDGFDCAFQKDSNTGFEGLYLKINGLDEKSQRNERDLEKAFIKFVREECSEKT